MLDDLNALLEAAKELPELPAEGEYQKLPDGDYEAIITKVEFKESKKGNLMFVWEFIISEGEFTKYHEWKYSMLNSPENMQRLVTDLKKFGINTNSMETIEADFELLLDVPVTLKIESKANKQNPDAEPFRNVSVKPCNL